MKKKEKVAFQEKVMQQAKRRGRPMGTRVNEIRLDANGKR